MKNITGSSRGCSSEESGWVSICSREHGYGLGRFSDNRSLSGGGAGAGGLAGVIDVYSAEVFSGWNGGRCGRLDRNEARGAHYSITHMQ